MYLFIFLLHTFSSRICLSFYPSSLSSLSYPSSSFTSLSPSQTFPIPSFFLNFFLIILYPSSPFSSSSFSHSFSFTSSFISLYSSSFLHYSSFTSSFTSFLYSPSHSLIHIFLHLISSLPQKLVLQPRPSTLYSPLYLDSCSSSNSLGWRQLNTSSRPHKDSDLVRLERSNCNTRSRKREAG